VPNLFDPEFDELRGQEGFQARRARIGRQAGADRLGLSIWEVPPGQAAYPYHLHLGEEEVLIVLSGRPSLRTPDGWRELDEGEVVGFPVGEEGAHHVVLYPDSGKLGAAERRPGGLHQFFRQTDAVDYYEGERPPEGS
jgi:uncharacterized cupin superfamily protein